MIFFSCSFLFVVHLLIGICDILLLSLNAFSSVYFLVVVLYTVVTFRDLVDSEWELGSETFHAAGAVFSSDQTLKCYL